MANPSAKDTSKFTLVSKHMLANGTVLEAGDQIELSPDAAAALSTKLIPYSNTVEAESNSALVERIADLDAQAAKDAETIATLTAERDDLTTKLEASESNVAFLRKQVPAAKKAEAPKPTAQKAAEKPAEKAAEPAKADDADAGATKATAADATVANDGSDL